MGANTTLQSYINYFKVAELAKFNFFKVVMVLDVGVKVTHSRFSIESKRLGDT